MDAPDDAGRRFLRAARAHFEQDLAESFGERADLFEPPLRTHLFDLWVRARKRPAVPPDPGLQGATLEVQFRGLLETQLDEVMLASKLARVIVPGDGVQLELQGHLLRLEGSGRELPDLDASGTDDEFQLFLRKRLQHEGLVADPSSSISSREWLPVRMHETSGTLSGVDFSGKRRLEPKHVDTFLAQDGDRWVFPRPRPAHDYENCDHVQLRIDEGPLEVNTSLTWIEEDGEVEAVEGLITGLRPSVRAVYVAMVATTL